jgi:hypothetical protein
MKAPIRFLQLDSGAVELPTTALAMRQPEGNKYKTTIPPIPTRHAIPNSVIPLNSTTWRYEAARQTRTKGMTAMMSNRNAVMKLAVDGISASPSLVRARKM